MSNPPPQSQPEIIRRRAVFLLPGYDPAPPRRYREIYRSEAVRQAEITGRQVQLTAAERPAPFYGWQTRAVQNDSATQTEFWLLPWNDLVRNSMRAGVFGIYRIAGRTALSYIAGGAFLALLRLRWQPMLAVLFPLAILFGQLVVATVALRVGALLGGLTGLGMAAIMCYAAADWLRKQDNRFYTYYLLHLYAFVAHNAAQPQPELAQRMAALADAVQAALDDGVDEVLIVGHSLGAQIAVDVVGDMLRAGRLQGPGHVGVLTLGQVIPMMSFLPAAKQLRRNLNTLAASPRIFWLDVSSQADGGCFALADPVAVTGVAPPHAYGPKVISAAFAETVENAQGQRFFDRHFQYFRAFTHPENYDYFAITAGAKPLAARFEARNNSPQINQKTYSKQTDMADA